MLIDGIFPVAAIVALFFAGGFYWSNPQRPLNVATSVLFAYVALYLATLFALFRSGDGAVFLYRAAHSMSSMMPLVCWFAIRACSHPETVYRDLFAPRRSSGWLVALITLFTGIMCFTPAFIAPGTEVILTNFRWGFYFNYIAIIGLVGVVWDGSRALRTLTGIRKVELQVMVIASLAALVAFSCSYIASLLHNQAIGRISPLMACCCMGVAAWGVTRKRILDARQLFITLGAYGVMFVASVSLLYLSQRPMPIPPWIALCLATLLNFILLVYGHKLAQFYLRSFESGANDKTRLSMSELAQDLSPASVLARAENILLSWGRCLECRILTFQRDSYVCAEPRTLLPSALQEHLLKSEGWATPEKLERERPTSEIEALLAFLRLYRMGIVVTTPAAGGETAIVVALAERRSKRPFTYLDAVRLKEWTGLLTTSISRAQLSEKTRHSERLATMGFLGAGFAHEIRKALSPVKEFFEKGREAGSFPEVLSDLAPLARGETERIEDMVGQMLMITNPRELNLLRADTRGLVERCVEIQRPKASREQVSLVLANEDMPLIAMVDKSLEQVLINLISNAIEAIAQHTACAVREVRVGARHTRGFVDIFVSDSGPGVSPLVKEKLFQPFVTGKATGTGLGLMLSRSIAEAHGGTLSLEDSSPGATFVLSLPLHVS
jgi:signal transduction histidine kinase